MCIFHRVATSDAQAQDLRGDTDVGADDEVTAKQTPQADNRPVERLGIRVERSTAMNIPVCARGLLTTGLIGVDVSSTRLDDAGLGFVVAWTPWLRELAAAGKFAVSGFKQFSALQASSTTRGPCQIYHSLRAQCEAQIITRAYRLAPKEEVHIFNYMVWFSLGSNAVRTALHVLAETSRPRGI